MADNPLRELVQALLAEDLNAATRLIPLVEARLKPVAGRVPPAIARPSDAIQETLLRVVVLARMRSSDVLASTRSLDQLPKPERVIRCVRIDMIRRQKSKRRNPGRVQAEIDIVNLSDPKPAKTPSQQAVDIEEADFYRSHMSPSERIITDLHLDQELGFAEIGERLRQEPDTVSKKYRRMLFRLRSIKH